MSGCTRWSIRPGRLALLLWLGYAAFVLLRLAAHGWDPSVFVCAGAPGCNPAETPGALHVRTDGASYDGQYYYRIALAPADLRQTAHGITLDLPAYRLKRIGYPIVCWLFSFGHAGWLSVVMIGVNLVWLAVLMAVGMRWCRDLGVSDGWGLLPLLWPGLLMSLGRDLTEIQAATLLAAGAWLSWKEKPGWAALAFSGAVLTRETAILPLAGFGLYWLARGVRWKSRTSWLQAAWLLVPAAVMLAWHGYLRWRFGVWPMLALPDTANPLSFPPFSGILRFIVNGMPFNPLNATTAAASLSPDWVEPLYWLYSVLLFGLSLALILLPGLALRRSSAPMPVLIGWGVLMLLFASQRAANWACGPSAFLRVGNDVAALGLLIVAWNGPAVKRVTAWLMACGWLAAWPYLVGMP